MIQFYQTNLVWHFWPLRGLLFILFYGKLVLISTSFHFKFAKLRPFRKRLEFRIDSQIFEWLGISDACAFLQLYGILDRMPELKFKSWMVSKSLYYELMCCGWFSMLYATKLCVRNVFWRASTVATQQCVTNPCTLNQNFL